MLPRAPDVIDVTLPAALHRRPGSGVPFPQQKVAIEVDGWAWHVDADRFRNDRRKQNALVRGGWDPLRFTWHDLDGHPATVLAEVTATLASAA
jgi:very-short-patch-repair endonuclease